MPLTNPALAPYLRALPVRRLRLHGLPVDAVGQRPREAGAAEHTHVAAALKQVGRGGLRGLDMRGCLAHVWV